MGLFDRGTASGHLTVRSDRHRRKLRRQIEDRLIDLETAPGPPLELQPLVQIVGSRSYPAWRQGWDKAWKKKGVPYSTGSWPSALGEAEIGALLIPVPAGRVGNAIGKHPKPIADPTFIVGPAPPDAKSDDMALAIVAYWMQHMTRPPVVSGPPVVELLIEGNPSARHVARLDISWSLPEPDGL